MEMEDALRGEAASMGWEIAFLGIDRLEGLEADLRLMRAAEWIPEAHFRYLMDCYDFKAAASYPRAASIIVAARPCPLVRLSFAAESGGVRVDLPPGFAERDVFERTAVESFGRILAGSGKSLSSVNLPEKLAAARSGLAKVGMNGIAYVDGMGSFLRLACFVTDQGLAESAWAPVTMPEPCASCGACRTACPSQAIRGEGLPLLYDRCLCHWNEETEGPFPAWIDPSWHNAVIGCMHCQAVCPMNALAARTTALGPSFDAEETQAILAGADAGAEGDIPARLEAKLSACGLWKHRAVIGRNLRALIAR